MEMVKSLLKELLAKHNVSLRQLAREIDWDYESLRRLYNDEMDRYPRELLQRIIDRFNCKIDDIIK